VSGSTQLANIARESRNVRTLAYRRANAAAQAQAARASIRRVLGSSTMQVLDLKQLLRARKEKAGPCARLFFSR
jgi:hypothetical protein